MDLSVLPPGFSAMISPPKHAGATAGGPSSWKNQLEKLNQEIEGFKKLRQGSTSITPPSAPTSQPPDTGPPLEEQVASLQRTLQQVNSHLEREQLEKRMLQDELSQLRCRFEAFQDEKHSFDANRAKFGQQFSQATQEIQEKNEQIATLREEKAVMKEWLDRGVAECKRVAEEVQRLRSEVDLLQADKKSLAEEKEKLEQLLEKVMEEARENSSRLAGERLEKAAALDLAAERERALAREEESTKIAHAECERLASEMTRMFEQMRSQEEAEMHLRTITKGLSRTASGFVSFHTAVDAGDLAALAGPPPFNEEGDEGGTGTVTEVVQQAKAGLANLADVYLALRAVVRRRLEESEERCATAAQQQAAESMRMLDSAMHAEQELRERHMVERRILEGKVAELEAELASLSDSNVRSQQQLTESKDEADALRAKVMALESHAEQKSKQSSTAAVADMLKGLDDDVASHILQLEGKCTKLEVQNAKLKEKCKKMKVDWAKVTETREMCHTLEREKAALQEYVKKVDGENEHLHHLVEKAMYPTNYPASSFADRPALRGISSPSKRCEAEMASLAWREWQHSLSAWDGWQAYRSAPEEATGIASRRSVRYDPSTPKNQMLRNDTGRVSPTRPSGPWVPPLS